MKKAILYLLILLTPILSLKAQVDIAHLQKQKNSRKAKSSILSSIHNTSPNTALLLHKLNSTNAGLELYSDSLIKSEFNVITISGVKYIDAFIMLKSPKAKQELESEGVLFQGNSESNILTALIPLDELFKLVENDGIKYLGISQKVELDMAEARASSKVDLVHQGVQLNKSYQGSGVIVGIIDVGFDYTHPNFFDSTGAGGYRVSRVWEQNSNTGNSPTGFNYGREIIGASQIGSAQRDALDQSHGTHVAGIAAGAGGGVNNNYLGVAPKSELVFVSTNMTDVGIADGIEYIFNYASSQGKPCVINMSIGGHYGPHDGSSAFDQFTNTKVGPGKLLVGSAGNEGGDQIFIEKNFNAQDTVVYTFLKDDHSALGTDAEGRINIWGNTNQNFLVAVNIYNASTNSFEDWTPYVSASTSGTNTYVLQDADFFADDCIVTISSGLSINNRPEVVLEIDHTDQDDSYRWAMIEIIAQNGKTQMWSFGPFNASFTNGGFSAPILDGSTNSTMGEIGGTSPSVISVGAYTTKNNWTSFSGANQTAPFNAPLGEIAPFSSKGPTADGRTKPDITAPGNVIVSSTSSFDANYGSNSPQVESGITDGNKTWWFSSMQGTSMSAPMVTGIMALWLEAYPALNPQLALNIIKGNSMTDVHTGIIGASGSNTWGHGKINAHTGLLSLINQTAGIESINSLDLQLYPNPASKVIYLIGEDARLVNEIHIYDMYGKTLLKKNVSASGSTFQLDIGDLDPGSYLVRVFTHGNQSTLRLIVN